MSLSQCEYMTHIISSQSCDRMQTRLMGAVHFTTINHMQITMHACCGWYSGFPEVIHNRAPYVSRIFRTLHGSKRRNPIRISAPQIPTYWMLYTFTNVCDDVQCTCHPTLRYPTELRVWRLGAHYGQPGSWICKIIRAARSSLRIVLISYTYRPILPYLLGFLYWHKGHWSNFENN